VSIIVGWISRAWEEVPTGIIPKWVLKCCLYNAEDGTKDDILQDNSEQSATEGSFDNFLTK
jgi:hypothetical protein